MKTKKTKQTEQNSKQPKQSKRRKPQKERKVYARSKELVPPFSMWFTPTSQGDIKIGRAGVGKFASVSIPAH
jgi:hypothetical protein